MTSTQFEQLRHVALEVLATRHPAALNARSIIRRVRDDQSLDFAVTEETLQSALEFLSDKGLVKKRADDFGSTEYWQATAEGVLFFERN